MAQHDCDFAVVGGGVMGLAMADAIQAAAPDAQVLVLDKEPSLGRHASGRNSGVLHAGFYYAPDSLKAQLTRRGNILLHQFCEERAVPVRRCGKVVVATTSEEVAGLAALHDRGIANGVPVELIDPATLRQIEPLARTVDRALWSPTTSVASPAAVVEALAERVRERGGRINLSSGVTAGGAVPGGVVLRTDHARIRVGHVVNAAGLYADRVAGWFGMCDDYVMLPFKGLYWYANWSPGRLRAHVYPVPDHRNPFLGVHLTVTVDGRVKVGPTAIPALWREDYGRVQGLSLREVGEIICAYPGFLRSPHHDVAGLIRSELPKYVRRHLVTQARALVPAVQARDFTERGRPGIRAQLLHVPSRRLEMDFVVRGDEHSTHILNAVSPAWTSSLAVAEHVVSGMRAKGVL